MTVRPDQILPIAEFTRQRQLLEREAIANATLRRVCVGGHLAILFENHVSVAWQVQEMCRVEGITTASTVQHELDTYNALLPTRAADGSAELSATLLVQYTDEAERDAALRALVGLHEHLYIEIAGERSAARFDGEQFNSERISSVQFVRFPLSAAAATALGELAKSARLVCTHPAQPAEAALGPVLRGALVGDLQSA